MPLGRLHHHGGSPGEVEGLFSEYLIPLVSGVVSSLLGLLGIGYKLFQDYREARRARERVFEAEKEAFKAVPESFVKQTQELRASQVSLEQQAREINRLIESSQNALRMGTLFDLYAKQIEKYQTETQARAGWSFIFAIIAMFAGLGFVVWGGAHILTIKDWQHVAAGSAISAIGGSVSAYITKTFLDVHRLSLNQLNHYFRQPVINAHVLTAQRLADQLEDVSAKKQAYETIIANVTNLIREDELASQVGADGDTVLPTLRSRKKRKASAPTSGPEPPRAHNA